MQIEQGDASPMERDNDGATPAHFAAARGMYFVHVRYRLFLVCLQNCEANLKAKAMINISTLRMQGVDIEGMKVTTGTLSHAKIMHFGMCNVVNFSNMHGILTWMGLAKIHLIVS